MNDDALLLSELRRLEMERKLRSIPAEVLETAWVREAQIEAVIDAILTVHCAGDDRRYARTRLVGEWCARIADELGLPQGSAHARRFGVLAEIAPAIIRSIPETEYLSSPCQQLRRIFAVASAFQDMLDADKSPRQALILLRGTLRADLLEALQALWRSFSSAYRLASGSFESVQSASKKRSHAFA